MKHTRDYISYMMLALIAAVGVLMPEMAYAQLDLCPVVDWLTGDVAKAVATVAIIAIGIMAALGRVQWTQCIIVAIGVAVIFGVDDILALVDATGCGAAAV